MSENPKKPELLYQIIYDATRDKFSILPTLSGLMLAILAVGISGGLFQIDDNIKYVATILLLLMILSLQVYYSETSSLLVEASNKFDEHFGRENSNHSLTFTKSIKYLVTGKINGKLLKDSDFFDRFSSQLPGLALLIIWMVVFFLIYEIWH